MIFVIGALFGGFAAIMKKPALLLPSLLAAALLTILLLVSQAMIQGLSLDLALNEAIPQAGLQQLPFLLYSMYAGEINLLLLLGFVFLVASNWLAFCFGSFAKRGKGISSAMGFATANIASAFYLAIFNALVFGFFLALLWLAGVITVSLDWLGLAATIIVLLVGLLAYLILLFLPTIVAVEEASIKEALKESSAFVRKRIIGTIVFVLVVGLVYVLVSSIGAQLAASINGDLLSAVVEFVFLLIAITYGGIAVPLYYFSAKK